MIRRLVFLIFVLVVLVITAAAVYLLVPQIGDLSKKSLAHSVAREVETEGKLKKATCSGKGQGRFTCKVPGKSGKPATSYAVRMEDKRCYVARRTTGPGKARKKGCIGLRDQLRFEPFERLL